MNTIIITKRPFEYLKQDISLNNEKSGTMNSNRRANNASNCMEKSHKNPL